MNKIELLQRASTESVPVLRKVTERFRQLFPELKLRPNSLERTPNTDTFVTTNLRRQFGEIESIENDFVNMQTQKVESKIKSSCTDSLKRKEYQLQEIGENEKVINDLEVTDLDGFQIGTLRQYEYGHGHGKNPIKETIYDSDGGKEILIRDELGNVLSKEKIPKHFARTKTEFHDDGSKIKRTYQKSDYAGDIEYIEERNSLNKITRLCRNAEKDPRYNYLAEFNPESGKIVRLNLGGTFGKREFRIDSEFTPDNLNVCKSFKFTHNDGEDLLNVVYDDMGNIVNAKGSYIDLLRTEKGLTEKQINDKLLYIRKPEICGDSLFFDVDPFGFDYHHSFERFNRIPSTSIPMIME